MNNSYPQFSFVSESEFALYYKHQEKNIAMVQFKDGELISLERAKEIVNTMDGIMDTSQDCYSIAKVELGSIVSRRARQYFAQADTYKSYKKAIAIIFNDLPQRIVYNFYIQFNKPAIKHKSFNSTDNAVSWLIKQGA